MASTDRLPRPVAGYQPPLNYPVQRGLSSVVPRMTTTMVAAGDPLRHPPFPLL
jgi:hypothetical protein